VQHREQVADAVLADALFDLLAHGLDTAADHRARVGQLAKGDHRQLRRQAEIAGIAQDVLDSRGIDISRQRERWRSDRPQRVAKMALHVLGIETLGLGVRICHHHVLQQRRVRVAVAALLLCEPPEALEDPARVSVTPNQLTNVKTSSRSMISPSVAGDPEALGTQNGGRGCCSGRGQMLTNG
jgi:hypothetical protein